MTVTFKPRVAVNGTNSWYEINLTYTPTGPCWEQPGGGGGRAGDRNDALPAGRRSSTVIDESYCPRTIYGDVVYNGNPGHTSEYVPHVGYVEGVLVGVFHTTMR